MNRFTKTVGLGLLAAAISLALTGCESTGHEDHAHATASKPYPLAKCLITDEDFHGEPYAFVHEGQEIKLCCEDCLAEFNKDTGKYLKKIAAAGQ